MTSRQVQNVSAFLPLASASPAMARWKAWLCRFMAAGAMIAWDSSPSFAEASVCTAAIAPPSIVTRTSDFQPSGVSALAA